MELFYGAVVETAVRVPTTATAEAVKITENIFRAVNIALVNELKLIYDKMGIDIWEVIDGAATKPFGYMPFYPGPGLGGHCIPIDPFYLTWRAREFEVPTRFIELAGEINTAMPHHVIDRLREMLDRAIRARPQRVEDPAGRRGLQEERLGHARKPLDAADAASGRGGRACRVPRPACAGTAADAGIRAVQGAARHRSGRRGQRRVRRYLDRHRPRCGRLRGTSGPRLSDHRHPQRHGAARASDGRA
jgi:hypothetical protein